MGGGTHLKRRTRRETEIDRAIKELMILGKALQPEELQSLEVKVKNTDKEPNVNTFERNSAQVLII